MIEDGVTVWNIIGINEKKKMLKENQTERSVLFFEDDTGNKVQFEYSDGTTLTQVATFFKNFLQSTGFDYVTDVQIGGRSGQWTSEPPYHPGHEGMVSSDYQQEDPDDDIPF